MYACKLEGICVHYNISEKMVARVHQILVAHVLPKMCYTVDVILLGGGTWCRTNIRRRVHIYYVLLCTVNCYSFHFL